MTKFLARVLAFALVCAAALAICALRAAPQVAMSHSQGNSCEVGGAAVRGRTALAVEWASPMWPKGESEESKEGR